jgi:hypothetical protein
MSRIGNCICCGKTNIPIGVDGECANCEAEIAQQEAQGEEALRDLDPDIGQHDAGHDDDYQQEMPEKF